MKPDFQPLQEICGKLQEAAEKEQMSEEFRQSLYTFLDMSSEFYATLQELLVRQTSENSHLSPSGRGRRGKGARAKSSRKQGGQAGHPGNSTGKAPVSPDRGAGLEPGESEKNMLSEQAVSKP